MRSKKMFNVLASRISKIWPRKLIHKIALTNVIVLLITIAVLSWYSLSEKLGHQVQLESEQFRDHAAQIARLSKSFLRKGNIDELEAVISSFLRADNEYSVAIKDVGFNDLIALKNTADNQIINIKNSKKIIAPVTSGELVQQTRNKLEIWYQIDDGNSDGWVYIERKIPPLSGLTLAFVKTTTTVLLLSVSICLLFLQRIMREPMQSLRRAAEFSEWLDMTQGNHLQVNTDSREVEYLVHALNKTSEKMYQKGLVEKRNHMLVDAIRDIQTKYIESTKPDELYNNILNHVVSLSGDEFGFFGEVKKSRTGKSYMKMRTFTKLGENVSIQSFIENNSPPNMEFHNTHNLIGAVIQTRKPVIANDPFRDPRSGGLPKGHPPVNSFLALPVFSDDEIVAIIGLANRRGGYDQTLVDYLDPLLHTVGHIVVANQFNKRRKIARYNLEQREILLRRILSTVSDSIITINRGGFIETVNPATEKMFGYLEEEMLNKHLNSLIPGIFGPDFVNQYVLTGNDSYHNSEGERKDGSYFPIELMVSEFKIGDERMYTVTIIDVSHLTAETNGEHGDNKSLFEVPGLVQAGPWELDLSSKLISTSSEVLRIFGITEEKNVIKLADIVDRILDVDRPIVQLALDQCAQAEEEFVIDVRLKVDGPQQHFAQIQGRPKISDSKGASKIIGVIQDVTRTNNLMKMKDEFITTVSEEIRSPLASIRGSIGALSGRLAKHVTEKEKFLLDTAYQNTDRLILLINDILDIENIATGKTEFNMEFLECRKVLDSAMLANSAIEKDYGVRFKVNVESRDIVLIADKRRLLQLLNIVCLNAARHSPEQSTIEINATVEKNVLLIAIKDKGEGIPEDIKSNIFDLYERTEYFRSDHPESTGLGLCVAKSIVDRHKGTIDVESQVGAGTTVYIRFPVPQQNVAVLNL